jgi:hypothetical protein
LLRLAELTTDIHLRQILTGAAQIHGRIARDLDRPTGPARTSNSGSPQDGGGLIKPYRMYFLDKGVLIAMHEFNAETDIAALAVAFAIHDASSDDHRHFELWHGARVLARSADRRGPKRSPRLEAIALQRQDQLLEIEEVLLDSNQALASSRRFLAATELLRRRPGRP